VGKGRKGGDRRDEEVLEGKGLFELEERVKRNTVEHSFHIFFSTS
jgi:hypothetical protein